MFLTASFPLHICFGSIKENKNLFTADALKSLCDMETRLTNITRLFEDSTCRSQSVGKSVGLMQGKPCNELTDMDLTQALQTLQSCEVYLKNGSLSPSCFDTGCPLVPAECTNNNASVFVILHYLTDKKFVISGKLTYTNIQVAVKSYGDVSRNFYKKELWLKNIDNEHVKLVGLDEKFKIEMFGVYTLFDMVFFILAGGLVGICSLLYLKSVLITVALMSDIIFTLLITYFIYNIIFRMPFFPFMNAGSGLIIIAITADAVFLYSDTLDDKMQESPHETLAIWTAKTMQLATLSIFVTSLTTACAFYSNYVSEVTAVKCFAVFVGTAMMINFGLMVTWVPSLMIISKQYTEKRKHIRSACSDYLNQMQRTTQPIMKNIFGRIIPMLVTNYWFVWLFLFTGLSVAGAVIIFYKPKLELPTNEVVPIFRESNPVEKYETTLKDKFRFAETEFQRRLDVNIVWGVEPIDNGNYLAPYSNGSLVFDKTFDLSLVGSQSWMQTFCENIKKAKFISTSESTRPCTLDVFVTQMTSDCSSMPSYTTCCNHTFPFPPVIFNKCFYEFSHANPISHYLGQPYFDTNTNKIYTFIITLPSTQIYSFSYPIMKTFAKNMDDFMEKQNTNAPTGIKNGFMTSNLQLYDTLRSLGTATFISLGISITVALIVMTVITKNLIVTMYAMLTIICTIFVVEGIFVLLGWELNMFESMIFSLTIGFAIDFTIHYSVAYRLSKEPDRIGKTSESISKVGAPVLMGGVTTFMTGVSIQPAALHPYRQFGTFLMVMMVVSWLYSTFYFQSLCRIAGPTGTSGNITEIFSMCKKKKRYHKKNYFSNVYDRDY